jgi:hypothetical protein
MFHSYDEFLNESREERGSVAGGNPMTKRLKNSLERIGKNFKTDEDIIKAIEALGFEREPLKPNSQTAEYIFRYAKNDEGAPYKYITYKNGYVRSSMPQGWWSKSHSSEPNKPHTTPISNQVIPTTRERLLLVLRRALKRSDIYQVWIKTNLTSDDPVAEFFEKKRGTLAGMKYGL